MVSNTVTDDCTYGDWTPVASTPDVARGVDERPIRAQRERDVVRVRRPVAGQDRLVAADVEGEDAGRPAELCGVASMPMAYSFVPSGLTTMAGWSRILAVAGGAIHDPMARPTAAATSSGPVVPAVSGALTLCVVPSAGRTT